MQPAARPFKAIVWMIGALASFATMTVSIRELTGEMHAFQMLFIRSVIGIAILLPVIARSRRGWGQIGRRYLPGHLLRNVLHFTGPVLLIFSLALLPLATVAALAFTSPLWAGVLAMMFLGERLTLGRAAPLALRFP